MRLGKFDVVATLTSQRQIVRGGLAAEDFRSNVFVGMRLRGM